jgi:alpha-tubulin suppressor-like RCC1 family protein
VNLRHKSLRSNSPCENRPQRLSTALLALVLALVAVSFLAVAPSARAASVAAGANHSCAITGAGDVRCWGANADGQLGDGTNSPSSVPVIVNGAAGATSLAAGATHTCALIAGGTIKCWGNGANGRLGDGGTSSSNTPVSVSGVTTAVQVVAGGSHTCALLSDLTVSCWGLNTSGQLGDGSFTQRITPTPVSTLANAVRVAAGANHTCAISGGAVHCWGLGGSGQLGNGGTANSNVPVTATGLSSAALVTAGDNHTCAATNAGDVRCWGLNANGQLGDGSTTPANSPVLIGGVGNVNKLTAGATHTCAVESTANFRCWGRGASGELGDGGGSQQLTPIATSGIVDAESLSAGGQHTCAINVNGPTQCWGENGSNELGDGTAIDRLVPKAVRRLNGVLDVSTGFQHTCVVRVTGSVACMGDNVYGQIGDGTSTTAANPWPTTVSGMAGVTAIGLGANHSCAIDGGQGKCWGRGNLGQLGNGGTSQQNLPVDATGFTSGQKISGGNFHTCGFLVGGQAKCWGPNTSGQLGDGTWAQRLTPTNVSSLADAVDIAVGGTHSCAIASGGQAKCFGLGNMGQLGNGGTSDLNVPTNVTGVSSAVSIGGGNQHSCVALADGSGRCWGINTYGQIGDGSTSQRNSPATVSGLSGAFKVDAGDFHSCALIDAGAAKCWGSNLRGQLGDAGASGSQSDTPVDVGGLTDATQLALGGQHTCAVTGDGNLYCWGYNNKGQLGDTTINNQSVPTLSDMMEPVVRVNSPAEGALTGDTTPAVNFSLIEVNVTNTECSVDGGAWEFCGSGWEPSTPLALGPHHISVRATDSIGNLGVTTRSFSVGTPPPTLAIDSPADASWVGDATPDISFTTTGTEPLTHECRVDGGSWVSCGSPWTAPALTDASHTVDVRVTDGFSNVANAAVTFSVDATVPSVSASAPADNAILADSTPSLSFSASDTNSITIECRVDSGGWSTCASPWTTAPLADGAHTLQVRATDQAGNVGSDSVPVTVDVTAPATTFSAPPAVTGDATPSVGFSITDTTTVTTECRIDAASYGACNSPWTAPSLADGAHTAYVRATDQAGNVSVSTRDFTVDTVLPVVDSFAPGAGSFTADTTPSFSFSASDAGSTTVECNVDGGAWAGCSSPHTTAPLGDGAHTLNVRATDAAGNVGTGNVSFTVDSQTPAVSISAPAGGSSTNDNTPSVSFNATDATATTLECRVDGGAWGGCASPFTTATLADGAHTVDVRATDQASNVGTASVGFTVDTGLPVVDSFSPGDGSFTADTTPAFSFSVTDSAATTAECRIDSGSWNPCSSPYSAPSLAEGAHTLTVRATDQAGNQDSAGIGFTVDSLAPAVNITAPGAGAFVNDNTPDVSFSVTDATATTVECRVDGGAWSGCTSPLTTATLGEGSHSVDVRAADQASNSSTASVAFTVDTVLPVVDSFSPGDGSFTADTTPAFSFNVTDATVTTLECSTDAGPYAPCTSPYTASLLGAGGHTVSARATDQAGNVGTGSVSFTVDPTAPVIDITAPTAGQHLGDTTPDVSFSVTDTTSTTRRCRVDGGMWSAPCNSPYTPTALTDGPHTVEVEATDQAGNVSTNSVSFTVDGTSPTATITAPADGAVTGDDTPEFTFSASDTNLTSVECRLDAGSWAPCVSPFTAPTLADGPHTFDLRAADQAGNVATDSISLMVDTGLPVVNITAPAPGAFLTNSQPDIVFTATDGGPITVECREDGGSWTACSSPYTTTPLGQGAHTVDVRATDINSNVVTDSVSFTVDSNPPSVVINSPNDFDVLTDATPDIDFTVTDSTATTIECNLDGGGWVSCASPWTTTTLSDGPHSVAVRATDQAGSIGSTIVNFEIDANPPVVDITAPADGAFLTNAQPDIAFTATDSGPLTVECREDGGSWTACSSPYTTTALGQGAHTVDVRATDSGLNATTDSVSFTVDSNPPSVVINSPNDFDVLTDATPDIDFTVTDITATTIECNLDGGGWVSCASPWTTTTLSDGPHSVAVRATDQAGSIGSTIVNFDIDANPPVVNITAPADGLVTSATGLDVTFTATDFGAVTTECRLDGGAFVPCTSPYSLSSLAEGPHTAYVRATDGSLNQTTQSVSFTVDTTAPAVTIVSPPDSTLTNDATPDVSFTVADTGSTTVECSVDGGGFSSCASPWTTPSLSDGNHTITVRATDTAGNAGQSAVAIDIDATAPSVGISAPAHGTTTGDNTPDVSFSATDALATTQECRIDAGAYAPCASPWTAPTLSDGGHTLTVRATDAAGNTATDSVSLTVDTTNPVVGISSPTDGATIGDTTPDIAFTVTDATAVTSQCRVDGGGWIACASPWTAPPLADGSHTVDVEATDAAGNTGTASRTFSIDSTLPTVTISSPVNGATTNNNTPSVSFSTTGSPPVTTECRVDSGAFGSCSSPWTVPALADGSHTLAVRATDALARTATSSITLNVDATAPAVTITAPLDGGATNNTSPNAVFTATDTGILTIDCSTDGGPFIGCSSPYAMASLTEGTHLVQVRATDPAGNQTTAASTFEVDLTAPVVTINAPAAGATVSTATPSIEFSATDVTAVTYSCSTDGGSYASCASPFTTAVLTNATHTVSVRATDFAGNQASSSVNFTVNAPVPPPTAPPSTGPAKMFAAAKLRGKKSSRKIKLTLRVYHPPKSTTNCDSSVLFKAKFGKKTVRVRGKISGVGPLCQMNATVKIPKGAKGYARINAMYFGNNEVRSVDADTAVKVK